MKLVITIEAQDEASNRLAVETISILDVNHTSTDITQRVMENINKVKLVGEKACIPSMVLAVLDEFGVLELSTHTDCGSEDLGSVIGVKEVGGIVFIRRYKRDIAGGIIVVNCCYEEEVFSVPTVTFLVTNSGHKDITKEFLTFVSKIEQ